jgi:serine/threonine-protein kinase HipA
MPLHLVGETIDKARSHRQAEAGKLVQLFRGIYVDAADDADAAARRHAVRIARYLYPNAYLSAASAVLLGPTRDGRLFLSGRRKQRTRIRTLEIIQNEAPKHPSLGNAIIDDGMGEFRVDVSAMRQRFLEAFRLRSEHAASIDDNMRQEIANRLIEEYGTPKEAATALWALARENGWHREAELAERFLLQRPSVTVRNEAALDLIVAWHKEAIGHLSHDGFEWRWRPLDNNIPPLIRQTTPGKLPPFIVSLLPEGWLESVLHDKDERAALRAGKRYMSNIMIVERLSELASLPADILTTRLSAFSKDGLFTGSYEGPRKGELDDTFERNLARLYDKGDMPRLSGIQIKSPMNLSDTGALAPPHEKPFTHIFKPAGTSGYEGVPIIEWLALSLGRTCGLPTPAASLVPMPDGMAPALIVERFDIREGHNDTHLIALEDMGSVLGVPTSAKYDSTIERVARAIRPLSTAADDDLILLLKRAAFAWLIADGDMHLKNLALLKVAEPGQVNFTSVRLSPLYDAVTTRVFPRLARDHMALKLNGKDDNLRRSDFKKLATTAGVKTADADSAIDQMLATMAKAVKAVEVPKTLKYSDEIAAMADKMFEIVKGRLGSFD